jgi:hypothetical protein
VDGDRLLVAFLGQTNIDLRFAPDAVVDVDGREQAVSRVSFQVEDPQPVTALLRALVRPR